MSRYDLSQLPDHVVVRELHALVATDRQTTADMLAYISESDVRRLYAPAGFPSLYAWCVEELRFSEDQASKRIQAARAARRFPVIFEMVADGRLKLTGVVRLAPHLDDDDALVLLASATHLTCSAIDELIVARRPKPDVPTRLTALPVAPVGETLPAPIPIRDTDGIAQLEHASRHVAPPTPTPAPTLPSLIAPLAPERFAFQTTLSRETRELMRAAQDALGSAVGAHDYDALLQAAFRALIDAQARKRHAATDAPRAQRSRGDGRYIPAHVKRAVDARDQRRCTFVSENGRRCACTRDLEYDHVKPFAEGSRATVENLRLRCRAHNQWAAEQRFGRAFMQRKREASVHEREREQAARGIAGTPWLQQLHARKAHGPGA